MVFVPFTGVDNHKKSVTFAAGLLSKEDVESYDWVFGAFLRAMGREPICIITDQCPSMKQSIPKNFTTSRHRLCMWHIMKKFPTKVGASTEEYTAFMGKINKFIWAEDIEITEFEVGWQNVINEYHYNENSWLSDLYANRNMWIPAFFRDESMASLLRTTSISESENSFFNQYLKKGDTLSEFFLRFESAMEKQRHVNARLNHESLKSSPSFETRFKIEKDAADVYTRSIFYDVCEEIKAASYDLTIHCFQETEGARTFTFKDKSRKQKLFEVKHDLATNAIHCSCKKFEMIGILCKHVFLALYNGDISTIPRQYVLNRWRKNAEHGLSSMSLAGNSNYPSGNDAPNVILNEILFDFQSCVGNAGMDKSKLELIQKQVKDLKITLCGDNEKVCSSNKNALISEMVGSHMSTEIVIQVPVESRNKGCGKRLLSAPEKSIKERKKALRTCKSCGEMCNHDSRNCPKKKL